jgi:hypothetical protein
MRREVVPATTAVRVGQLLPLALSSDQGGEVIAAVEALRRALDAAGLDHHDLAAAVERGLEDAKPRHNGPEPDDDWRSMAWTCFRSAEQLSPRDRDFIEVILGYQRRPSDKQLEWLVSIHKRVLAGAAR